MVAMALEPRMIPFKRIMIIKKYKLVITRNHIICVCKVWVIRVVYLIGLAFLAHPTSQCVILVDLMPLLDTQIKFSKLHHVAQFYLPKITNSKYFRNPEEMLKEDYT